jgi:hypothetical protein
MNFNDYIISDSDYKFFNSLPKDEKLLFIYDLICEEAYGPGSIEEEEEYNTPEIESDLATFDNIAEILKSKLHDIVAASISDKAPVNMLIMNDKMVLNSNSLALIKDTVNQMLLTGYILSEDTLTKKQANVFHQLKYCKIYTILAKHKISFN